MSNFCYIEQSFGSIQFYQSFKFRSSSSKKLILKLRDSIYNVAHFLLIPYQHIGAKTNHSKFFYVGIILVTHDISFIPTHLLLKAYQFLIFESWNGLNKGQILTVCNTIKRLFSRGNRLIFGSKGCLYYFSKISKSFQLIIVNMNTLFFHAKNQLNYVNKQFSVFLRLIMAALNILHLVFLHDIQKEAESIKLPWRHAWVWY